MRRGHQPLPNKRVELMPMVLAMNRQSNPHRSPAWELRGVSVQYGVLIHDVFVGGPRGKTPAVKDSMHTI
jgi:hypothetical protein